MEDDISIDYDHPENRSSAARRAYPQPLPRGTEKYLCEQCQTFCLQPADFYGSRDWIAVNNANEYFDLGTTEATIARSERCSLCRLVVHCLDLRSAKTPIRNKDGSYTTLRLKWYGSSPRWNRVLDVDESPNFLRPAMYSFGGDEESYDNSPSSKCRLVPCGEDMTALGARSATFYGRLPAPTQEYLELIKRWLDRCSEMHGSECSHSMQPKPGLAKRETIMVIDVKRGCLVDIPFSNRYFAISYVWGREATFETLRGNVGGLRRPGGISEIRGKLPRTITDAMDLLLAIGESYLWCDRLCIVQDDARTKHSLISRMDEVYGSAYAVIIARSGANADAGLFGQHPWHKEERLCDEMRLVAVPDYGVDRAYGMAPIEDRAWTFQEQMLSRRALVFSNGMASFQCQRAIWRHDVILDDVHDRPRTNNPKSDWGFSYDEPMETLARMVVYGYTKCQQAYSARKLTFPSDALAAFSGIGKVIAAHLGSQLHFCLPVVLFDWAILWCTSLESARCNDLPSWSWAGWDGRKTVTLEHGVADLLLNQSWISWHYDDPDVGVVRPLRDLETPDGRVCTTRSQARARRARRHDYHAAFVARARETIQRREGAPVSPVAQFRRYCGDVPLETRVDPFPASSSAVPLAFGRLRFYTICAAFEVARHTVKRPYGETETNGIRDRHGVVCGGVEDARYGGEALPPGLTGRQDFVVLSEHFDEDDREAEYARELRERKGIRCVPCGRVCKEFNVMIVDWVDGVAYRKGLGHVCQIALDAAIQGPEWREVVLG
ncbi:uncharacterized protein DNG_04026 [Cephalotrichum gorgonifer]|uniref:Heterokaryon incompatibility domain-containing protein n=1 Tax=Cephalotrichum gorgonifer TaxID=2041049 RepID=A0AAE8MX75_9PEZI|nr:uncharacterized protein DNG_04026 [Cephalotrichum gorgonifer]